MRRNPTISRKTRRLNNSETLVREKKKTRDSSIQFVLSSKKRISFLLLHRAENVLPDDDRQRSH